MRHCIAYRLTKVVALVKLLCTLGLQAAPKVVRTVRMVMMSTMMVIVFYLENDLFSGFKALPTVFDSKKYSGEDVCTFRKFR